MKRTFVTVVRPARRELTLLTSAIAPLAQAARTTFCWIHQKRLNQAYVKRAVCRRFGILARHWSGCRAVAQQAARAWREGGRDRLATLRGRLARLEASWPKECLDSRRRRRNAVARRKAETAIARLEKELDGRPRWCFGGRRLLRRGRLAAWRRRRDSEALFSGEQGKCAGNEVAQWSDGQLQLRLPDGLGPRYVVLAGVTFKPAQQALVEAAVTARARVSWRVKLLPRGKVQLCVTLDEPEPAVTSHPACGVVAADLNADHVAVADVAADGRPVGAVRLPLRKHSDAVWQMAKELVARASARGRAIVLENLDLRDTKSWLRSYGKRFADVLSRFRSRQVRDAVEREARRAGVEVWYVDPAWTSVLGALKYKRRCRLGGHHAAALVIGRRALGFGERLPYGGPATLPHTVECVSTSGASRTFVQRLPSAWLEAGRRRSVKRVRVRGTPAAGTSSRSRMDPPGTVEVSLPLAGRTGV